MLSLVPRGGRRLVVAMFVVMVAACAAPRCALAQEPSGLQAAVALESVLTDVIARNEKSVVAIARVKRGQRAGLGLEATILGNPRDGQPAPGQVGFIPNDYGTGVVIDRSGLILTHYHVLGEDCDHYVTTVDRKTYPAVIRGADPRMDLAVLQLKVRELQPIKDLHPIKFGDGSAVKKGQIVIALGNPYAIAADGQASASWGIVSNVTRKAGPKPDETASAGLAKDTLHHFGTLIQTDAKLNLGTSGGALVNLKGEMIGLTTSLAAAVGYEQAAGYAIPVDQTFRRAVETLKQGKEVEYGVLGVRPSNFVRDDGVPGKQGVSVEVFPGTPAERYGLATGDVITQVDGVPIHDADELVLQIGKHSADAMLRLTVERNGHVLPIHAELTKYPVRGKKVVTTPSPGWRGIRIDYATANPEFFLQRPEPREFVGVRITDVAKDSAAWKEGLRPNMFITHVGTTAVTTPKEFRAATAAKTGAVNLRLALPANDRPVRTIPADDG